MTRFQRRAAMLAAGLAATAVAAFGAIWSGVVDVAADVPHARLTYALLEVVRERSIAVRAAHIALPTGWGPDRARAQRAAGNYDAMCAGCHLAPGVASSELSRGLYPQPPNLTERSERDPAHLFWVIKHGIKASGMPAWGRSMGDDDVWDLVAFVQTLPQRSPAQYAEDVQASAGHAHAETEAAVHAAPGAQGPPPEAPRHLRQGRAEPNNGH